MTGPKKQPCLPFGLHKLVVLGLVQFFFQPSLFLWGNRGSPWLAAATGRCGFCVQMGITSCNLGIEKHHPFGRCIVLRIDICNQTHFSILHIAHDKKHLFPVVLENEITGRIFFYNCTFCVFYEKWDYLIFQKNLIFRNIYAIMNRVISFSERSRHE